MGLIATIVMVGGATRLTGSGLSMVDWRPIMGVVPPLTDAMWDAAFVAYKAHPEFNQINKGMTMSAFKVIFYWEYAHRMLGRLIGLVAVVPFLFFWVNNQWDRAFTRYWLVVIGLIGIQGGVGWYMVKSGLVDVPHVSHFRLAFHLCLAFMIFSMVLLAYLDRRFDRPASNRVPQSVWVLTGVLALQIVYGAFTAGLHGGYYYNTYPKMGEAWLPESAFMHGSLIKNIIDNPIMIQWIHRWLAVVVVVAVVVVWRRARVSQSLGVQYSGWALCIIMIGQFVLGVLTLLTGVWLPIALAHQFGALMALASVVCLHYFGRRDPSNLQSV